MIPPQLRYNHSELIVLVFNHPSSIRLRRLRRHGAPEAASWCCCNCGTGGGCGRGHAYEGAATIPWLRRLGARSHRSLGQLVMQGRYFRLQHGAPSARPWQAGEKLLKLKRLDPRAPARFETCQDCRVVHVWIKFADAMCVWQTSVWSCHSCLHLSCVWNRTTSALRLENEKLPAAQTERGSKRVRDR